MSRGGKRAGAGRKSGSASKRTREIADRAVAEGVTPLEIMLGAARILWQAALGDGQNIDHDKVAAAASIAKDAAPYVHPRLASVEHKGADDGPIRIVMDSVDAAA